MPFAQDLVDKIISTLAKPETRLVWFRWLESATVSAAVYGLGRHAAACAAGTRGILSAGWELGAVLLIAAAIVSETILVWHACSAVEGYVVTIVRDRTPRSHPMAARMIVLALAQSRKTSLQLQGGLRK